MRQSRILNTREIKGILETLNRQWGADSKKKFSQYVVLLSSKDRLYLLSRDFAKLDDKKLRIDSAGLYFGEIMENREIRLSIEGSQLIGPLAEKNVAELDDGETKLWLSGADLEKDVKAEGFVILKNRNITTGKYDFLGCGKYKLDETKKGKILNYVPKSRRITSF